MKFQILSAKTPAISKRLGKRVSIRTDWDDIKFDIMTNLVERKFNDHPVLMTKLLDTGNGFLVEGNWWGDTYWGVCDGIGENNLGKILMSVRERNKEKN